MIKTFGFVAAWTVMSFGIMAGATDPQVELNCAAQVAVLVKSARTVKNKSVKSTIFTKAIDKDFIALIDEVRELHERAIPGAPPDEFLQKKMSENFTKTVALARLAAAKPMNECIAYFEAFTAAVPTVCPEAAAAANDRAKMDACDRRVNENPAVKKTFDAWQSAKNKLLKK